MLRIGRPATAAYYLHEITRQRSEIDRLGAEGETAATFFPGGETAEFYVSAPIGEVAFGISDGQKYDALINRKLLRGRSKMGFELRQKQGEEGVSGYEFLFPAPKSVSVIWALSVTERAAEATTYFWSAHTSAVKVTLNFFARTLVSARAGRNGRQEVTEGAIAGALFHHYDNRPEGDRYGDPHLHTHAVIYNSHFDGRKCRTLNSKYFHRRDAVFLLGQAYQKALGDTLVKANIPLTFVREANNLVVPHISAMPANVVDEFSRRKTQIHKFREGKGGTNQYAAMMTRKPKQSDIISQLSSWRQTFRKFSITLQELQRRWRVTSEQESGKRISPTKSVWSRLLRGGRISILEAQTEAIRLSSGDASQPLEQSFNVLLASPLIQTASEDRHRGSVRLTASRKIARALKDVRRAVGELFAMRMRLVNEREFPALSSEAHQTEMVEAERDIAPSKPVSGHAAEQYTPHISEYGSEYHDDDVEAAEPSEAEHPDGPSMRP